MEMARVQALAYAKYGVFRVSGNPTLERARSDETLSDTSSAPRVRVRPIHMTMEVCGASLSSGVRRLDKCAPRVQLSG